MKKLALFDFDGTITRKDSLIEFIHYTNGFFMTYFGLFLLSPIIFMYKIKLIPNYRAKEMLMRYFWFGRDMEWMKQQGRNFSANKLPEILKEDALKKINWYKNNGWEIAVVSASSGVWVSGWTEREGIEFIGTKLQKEDGNLTGRIKGKNCYGEEKVNRIKEIYNLEEYQIIHAYGDSAGDHEMLQLAHRPFFRTFKN